MKRSPGKWYIEQAADGTYYTKLVSRNGLVLCQNTGFENRENAKKNIEAISSIAKISPIVLSDATVVKAKRKTPYMKRK